MFTAIQPSNEDIEAYARGYFPSVVLGNHVQWALNYLGIEENAGAEDCYPRFRMHLSDACNLYMERMYYD